MPQIEQKVVIIVTGIITRCGKMNKIDNDIQALNADGWTVSQCVPSMYEWDAGFFSATSFLLLCTREKQAPEPEEEMTEEEISKEELAEQRELEKLSEEELAEMFAFTAANAG